MAIKYIEYEDLPEGVKKKLLEQGKDITATEVFKSAAENLLPSALQFGEDLVQPFIHPIQTAKSLKDLGLGVFQLFVPGEQPEEKVAKAVGQYFADRYGGIDNIKNTFAQDPVGFLADATIILSGGGAAIAKTGKITKVSSLEKIGDAAKNISQKFDPALVPLKAIRTTGNVAKTVSGVVTGVGDAPVDVAFKSGQKSISLSPEKRMAAAKFKQSMKTPPDATSLVFDASNALRVLEKNKIDDYMQDKAGLNASSIPIDADDILKALEKTEKTFTENGVLVLSDSAKTALNRIKKDVDDFVKNPDMHNVSGADILKRLTRKRYNNKLDADDSSAVVATAANDIRDVILKASPEYGVIMDAFEKASIVQDEIQKSLSLGPRAAVDTTIKKLQNSLREQPGFGTKQDSLKKLNEVSDTFLMERLAGSNLSGFTPKGLQQVSQPISFVAALTAGPSKVLPILLAQTPRLVGEGAYRAGQFSPLVTGPLQAAPYLRAFEATQKEEDPRQRILNMISPTISESLQQ